MIAKKNIGWTILTLALLAGGESRGQSKFNQTSGEWTNALNWTPTGRMVDG